MAVQMRILSGIQYRKEPSAVAVIKTGNGLFSLTLASTNTLLPAG